MSELIPWVLLLPCVLSNAQNEPSGHMWVNDDPEGYRFACGPLSLYAACLASDEKIEFDRIVKASHFKRGEGVEIGTLCNAAKQLCPGRSSCERLGPVKLRKALIDGGAAVLFVRKGSSHPNHAIAVVDVRTVNEKTWFSVVDYPKPIQERSAAHLTSIWDGDTILLSSVRASQSPGRLELFLWLLLPGLVVFVGLNRLGRFIRGVSLMTDRRFSPPASQDG